MERRLVVAEKRGIKRHLDDGDGDRDRDKDYRFKVLLFNGVAVTVKVADMESISSEHFIRKVKIEYLQSARNESKLRKGTVNWSGGDLRLEDVNGNRLSGEITLANFKPQKCHILRLLEDGSAEETNTYVNMWDLTPDTDILKELPEEYTFETALADLIDNSLQAVWSNGKGERRLICVDIGDNRISITDTGPGMDDSDENSLAKWGKMGASLHRSFKARAIGCKPPYLKPFFGLFGYGAPLATLHLGRQALVSSKTKQSTKVYSLYLNRDALLNSGSERNWRTDGGMRDPSDDEIQKSPHGSFTKVEISELKIKKLDIRKLQCMLKDIYFPYIQCDEISNAGKTKTPVKFQVNGVDLAEILGGEVAITNMHSCNGDAFVFRLRLFAKQDDAGAENPGFRASQEANARIKCVYLPIVEGKESIEIILEKLEEQGCGIKETSDNFSRVSIRRLGRLLPDARWARLPFMDFRNKRGDRSQLLKRCSLRVKCFIETDAGFNPTPSKTDLAHHSPFTAALKNLGNKTLEKEKEVDVEIYRESEQLTPMQLNKEYQDWVINMHESFDQEINSGDDDPVLVVGPTDKKALGISADVVRVHRTFTRKGACWSYGQKVKVLKGAPGFYNNNAYATLEYFLIEGFEGDAGGEARIICRPLGTSEDNGCVLTESNGNTNLQVRGSFSLPISVIDSGKFQQISSHDWNCLLEKQRQKTPSKIDLLSTEHCQELKRDGTLPNLTKIEAGHVFPREIVAVVRPGNYNSMSTSKNLDQKFIFRANSEMSLQVKFETDTKNHQSVDHICSARVAPSIFRGIDGLYVFTLDGRKAPELFGKSGVYKFLFSLPDSSCEDYEKTVVVKASSKVVKWRIWRKKQSQTPEIRVGSSFSPIRLGSFDAFDNQIPFTSVPQFSIKVNTSQRIVALVSPVKTSISSDRLTLEIKDLVIKSNELDKIRPNYEATLVICSPHGSVLLSQPCLVTPGSLESVTVHPPIEEKHLRPGFVVKDLVLEMFDVYGNHVTGGTEVQVNLLGFHIIDQIGSKRKVDDRGCIDLSGLLQVTVTADFGSTVSISVSFEDRVILKQEFQIDKRELRVSSRVPEFSIAGSTLENLVFEVLDSAGNIDETFHDDAKCGQSHILLIKSDDRECRRSAFRRGRCIVPAIPLPSTEGHFGFTAAHSRYSRLQVSVKVPIVRDPEVEPDGIEFPSSDRNAMPLQDSLSLDNAGSLMPSSEHQQSSSHSDCSQLNQSNKVPVLKIPKLECDGIQSPFSEGKAGLLQDPSSLFCARKVMQSDVKTEKLQDQIQSPFSGVKALVPQDSSSLIHNKIPFLAHTERFEDAVRTLGEKIGSYEKEREILICRKAEIELVISQLKGRFPASVEPELCKNLSYCFSKEELVENILRRDSAAATVCHLSEDIYSQEPEKNFMKDILGLVALLGTISLISLSRILAEYLGEDQMLAVVCKSYEAACAVEKYKENGEVDCELALHAEAAAKGRSVCGRFLVICLEDIRPYTGELQGNDTQRKLKLADPMLPEGSVPAGFVGYAVNFVNLDVHHLHTVTAAGHGLRETLFYRLFGELQVYATREHMIKARACINHGAVSLDGGIIRENGIISLGQGDPEICFPVTALDNEMQATAEMMKKLHKNMAELQETERSIEKVSRKLEIAKKKFAKRKETCTRVLDFVEFASQLDEKERG